MADDTSLEPSNDLTAAPSGGGDDEQNRFILFTDSWLNLQNYITTGINLPINVGNFETKYGSFANEAEVKRVVAAMKKVQGLTTEFGNPQQIKEKLQADINFLLADDEPPAEIYSHIIWLALKIQNAAQDFTDVFSLVESKLDPKRFSKEQAAKNFKDLLIGQDGLVTIADDMFQKTEKLRQKLSAFGGRLKEANQEFVTYTSQSSAIMKAANDAIADLKRDIDLFTTQSEIAEKAWRDYTIAAVTVSVGLAIIGCLLLVLAPFTFGKTVALAAGVAAGAVAAAGALGHAAAKQLEEYHRLVGLINSAKAEQQKKTLLVTDLTSFNQQITLVGTGMEDFDKNLSIISAIWLNIASRLKHICTSFPESQLGNWTYIKKETKIQAAVKGWHRLGQVTEEFTVNSLVNYEWHNFGDPIKV